MDQNVEGPAGFRYEVSDLFITLLLPRLALSEYAGEPEVKDLYIRETLNVYLNE